MSLIGTVANYGGRQPNNFQNIKQFVVSGGSQAIWIYKKQPNGLRVQTPADNINPIYISSDLYVNGSIFNTSDEILKDNIISISETKSPNVLNLNPVKYSFKSDINNKIHEKQFDNNVIEINLSYNQITEIKGLDNLTIFSFVV